MSYDLFQTVCDSGNYELVTDAILNRIFEHNKGCYVEEEFVQVGEFIYYSTPLYEVLLDNTEQLPPK